MRAEKGNLFAGFRCKLPRRGGRLFIAGGLEAGKRILFLQERRGNVVENKGQMAESRIMNGEL